MKNRISEKKKNREENTVLDNRKKKKSHKKRETISYFGDEETTNVKTKKKRTSRSADIDDEKTAKEVVRKPKKPNKLVEFRKRVGRTALKVSGENCERALSAVMKICRVEDVKRSADGCTFRVKSKHLGKIIALLDNLCYDYKIIDNSGIAPYALSVVMRPGLLVGLMAVICAIIVSSQFVTRVSVVSAGAEIDAALKNEICAILDENGVKVGAKTSDVNEDSVQEKLLALGKISFVSVTRKGTRVDVVVKQALPSEYVFERDGTQVKAQKRAVVTRVVVTGGTAVKKYGDVVSPGDVLIDGYIEYGDEKIPVKASGYAYGKVYYEKTTFFPKESIVTEYGESKTLVRFGMFGKVPKTPDAPFEKYVLKTSVENYGFLLPILVYKFEFTAIDEKKVQNARSTDKMKRLAFSSLASEFKESAKVLNVYYDVKQSDGGVTVKVTAEAEELI